MEDGHLKQLGEKQASSQRESTKDWVNLCHDYLFIDRWTIRERLQINANFRRLSPNFRIA